MEKKERENFLRNAILIVDDAKDALVALVDLELSNKHLTFEQFINKYQHEIYHLCYASKCCKCAPGYNPPRLRVLHQSQLDLLLEKSNKLPCHLTSRSYVGYCCSAAKSGISTNILDITLARCLLLNFCSDVFWFSCVDFPKQTLGRFLNENKHKLYHLWQGNSSCCECDPAYSYPSSTPIFSHNQWNSMFTSDSVPCAYHRKRHFFGAVMCISSYSSIAGITTATLERYVADSILQHCCPLRHAVETLVKARNRDVVHAKEGKMSNLDFEKTSRMVEKCIMEIARICNTEGHFKKRIKEAKEGAIDETLHEKHNTLLGFLGKQQHLMQDICPQLNKISGKIESIRGKIAGKIPKSVDDSIQEVSAIFETEHEKLLTRINDTLDEIPNIITRCTRQTNDTHIPEEIKRMDTNSINLYRRLMKDSHGKRRHVRLVVVGPKGSGKTSLVKRILRLQNDVLISTNGIDIHILKCKISTDNGNWSFCEDICYSQVANIRLKKGLLEKLTQQAETENIEISDTNVVCNETSTSQIPSNSSEISASSFFTNTNEEIIYLRSDENVHSDLVFADLQTSIEHTDFRLDDFTKDEVNGVISVPTEGEEFATIDFWDFAGDKQFYNTHQTFLSNEALYIVTSDMTKDIEEIEGKEGEDPFFWFKTIHYYGKKGRDENTTSKPSIILVGTKKDLFQGSEAEGFLKLAQTYVKDPSIRHHIAHCCMISNLDDKNENSFNELRRYIFETARQYESWNQELPVRWIHLEKNLLQISSEKPIVSKNEIFSFAHSCIIPITEREEIELFLKYHHETGGLIYFADVPDYIILKPQWLANAFRCIVTSNELQTLENKWNLNDWQDIQKTGMITERFIKYIFNKNGLTQYRTHILQVMEKFDILLKPLPEANQCQTDISYYVPCMIETRAMNEIDNLFDNKDKSSCLCVVFEFLPPPMYNHVLGALTRKYTVSRLPTNGNLAFFKGMCVFNLESTGCRKLLLATFKNIIQLQVWNWKNEECAERQSYEGIRTMICSVIDTIQHERYKTCIPYQLKLKCNISKYNCFRGMKDPGHLSKISEYYCEEHGQSHKSSPIYIDWFSDQAKDDLSNGQINFIKIGIITLDILSDALYDLLIKDDPRFQKPRNKCDITSLYDEQRNRIRKHTPSRGRWGGQWCDLNQHQTSIGDDIERIRLTRNELQHSSFYTLQDQRFYEMVNLHRNVLNRFERHNSKTYLDRFDQVLKLKVRSVKWEEYKTKVKISVPKVAQEIDQYVVEGNGCTIKCSYVSPVPDGSSIYWIKEGIKTETALKVDMSSQNKYGGSTVDHPSLIILNTEPGDQGFYSCRINYPGNYNEIIESQNISWPKTFLHINNKN